MVVDLRGTGPYNGLSSYMALAPTMTDFCLVIKGCCLSFVLLVYMFCSCLSRLYYQVIPGKAFNNFLQSSFMKFWMLC